MTTPARIAAFLSTSALCLGLASAPAYASQRDADDQREARTLTRDRESVAGEPAAETARPAEAARGQANQDTRKR